ncbi:MAG: hypothetical protein IMX01_05075 [Limnochordaceae bacterium]|nr:hypothetical protein [Limnochordaceae bacterium]
MWTADEFFSDWHTLEAASLFEGTKWVWEALERLPAWLEERIVLAQEKGWPSGEVATGAWLGPQVYVAPGAVVEPGAYIVGPAWVGAGARIRHAAYVRENVYVGPHALVGHASEVKGSILLDGAQAPHFNYVGDSILGRKVNLGAGTRLSNLKNDGTPIRIPAPDGQRIDTGRRKLGAILGDEVMTGCNTVANPGTLVGPGTHIYAGALLRGWVPGRQLVKVRQTQEVVGRRAAS